MELINKCNQHTDNEINCSHREHPKGNANLLRAQNNEAYSAMTEWKEKSSTKASSHGLLACSHVCHLSYQMSSSNSNSSLAMTSPCKNPAVWLFCWPYGNVRNVDFFWYVNVHTKTNSRKPHDKIITAFLPKVLFLI